MAVTPANIGKVHCKVSILPRSPFAGIPRQEFGYFLTEDNLESMSLSSEANIVALPPPVNGYRLSEDLQNYDNYIQDSKQVLLENAVSDLSGSVSVDDAARAKHALATARTSPSGSQKDFFTWQTIKPLLGADTYEDIDFSKMFSSNSQKSNAKWTYNLIPKPDSKQSEILTPFMTQATKNPRQPIHWGVGKVLPIAAHQPFEVLYYHVGQVHTLAQEAAPLVHEHGLDGPPFNLDLTKKAYLAIKFGSGPQKFMLLFAQGIRPLFLQVSSVQGRTAKIIDVWDDINGDALFTPDNEWFQVKVEPVKQGFLINLTGQQFVRPWAVQSPSTEDPYFLREGAIEIYSGNITAGFCMRPVQYKPLDYFVTPVNVMTRETDDDRAVTVTTAIKGVADDQGKLSKVNGVPVLFAVDAEEVVGDSGGQVTSSIKALAKDDPDLPGHRKITLELIENPKNPSAPPPPKTDPPIKKSEISVKVILEATDMAQPGGYTVVNGKSPYIWQVRAELPMIDPTDSNTSGIDISCSVKEVDLNWNSTSLNELNHSGTIKVFNRPKPIGASGIDFLGYMDRAVYFRIETWWENGAGHDPGSDKRQVFEGMSVQASIEKKAEADIVTFKVEDYMNALEGGKFVLSPYYDGMKAKAAVRDIAQLAGLGASRILADDTPIPAIVPDDPAEFGLPFANPFSEGQFRFKDGSSYKAAVVKIAQLDGKTVYFDQKGRFHYDTIAGGTTGSANNAPVATFYTSPRLAPEGKFCAWGTASFSRQINDTYNVIQVSTVNRDTGAPIHIAAANEAALHDPQATGYLGYRKHLMIREPALGGAAAAVRYFKTYQNIVFKPPLNAHFETYGYSGLKPLDTIQLDGQLIRILSISSRIDAKENNYWMSIEGEWFYPST